MASATAIASKTERELLLQNRWLVLLFSVLSMVAVANLQYGWTFFVPSIVKKPTVAARMAAASANAD